MTARTPLAGQPAPDPTKLAGTGVGFAAAKYDHNHDATYAPISTVSAVTLGTLGYAQVTANQGTFTTLTDLTSLTVTVTVGAGRRIRVRGFASFSSDVGSDDVGLVVREGSTSLNQSGILMSPTANRTMSGFTEVILTPSAGSHTYKLSAQRNHGTGNITMGASASQPAFILAEDIGV